MSRSRVDGLVHRNQVNEAHECGIYAVSLSFSLSISFIHFCFVLESHNRRRALLYYASHLICTHYFAALNVDKLQAMNTKVNLVYMFYTETLVYYYYYYQLTI